MKTTKSQGFSLVELLIVMVLVAVALLGVMALQLANVASTGGNRYREAAVFLCKSQLDAIQAAAQREVLRVDYGLSYPKEANYLTKSKGTDYYNVKLERVEESAALYTCEWERRNGSSDHSAEFLARVRWAFELDKQGRPIKKIIEFRRIIYHSVDPSSSGSETGGTV